jgi:hypothetical protein
LLLAISGWQLADPLTKKSGAILAFKGLGLNSLHYQASCSRSFGTKSQILLHKPFESGLQN